MSIEQILNVIIDNVIDNVINETEIKKLLIKKDFNEMWINRYRNTIEKLKNENEKINSQIYKICNHNWDKDYDDLYSKHKRCTKCNLGNFPYIYK
tara:strand:+ start:426 stop:710 length:285 start_codon:yes stop_codon:yes gene_type:complete